LDLIFTRLRLGTFIPRTVPLPDRAALSAMPVAAPTKAAPPAINGIFPLLAT
jgi:hypothetical protein